MCGLCGVVDFAGRGISEPVVWAMARTLEHRGPDATGVSMWPASGRRADGGPVAAFGHNRLKIIDLSDGANQPMGNEDGTVWVVLNGEIYNFQELRDELKAAGHQFRTESDTEAIVHLYEEAGDACVDRLDGMFAIALWDERRRRLLLARDRTGKKPLYVSNLAGRLVFASEIKGLLAHPDVPSDLAVEALPALFVHGYVPGPATLYRGIRQLPPGHVLTAERDGGVRIRPYWDWRFPPRAAAEAPVSEPDATQELRRLMTAAVKRRLIADVPLGAFLSGGIDSSIVVALMARLMDQPVKTFSIGFAGDRAFDETRYARMVAERYGTAHTEFVVEPKAFDLIERLVHVYDGPFGDSSAIPTYILSELTRKHVTVALNGDGGDELFAGYLRFAAALWSARIPRAVLRAGRALTARLPAPANPRHPLRRAARFFGDADRSWLERYSRWISFFHDDVRALLRPDLMTHLAGWDATGYFTPYRPAVEGASRLSQLLYLNAKTYLADDLLVKMDRASMAHALETRSPFLDRALMEFVATLPDRFKLRGRTTKWLLRRAFADLLPPAILTRGKMGFGVPLATWFRGELREPLADLLLAPTARYRDYLDAACVRELVEAHLAGRQSFEHQLWLLLTFEVWLRSRGATRMP